MQSVTLAGPPSYPDFEPPEQDEPESEGKPARKRRLSEEERKMLNPSLDPFDMPLLWWESEDVKYAISYQRVRFRLLSLIESDIVRLTDRKYMQRLAARIQQDREKQQMLRIEERKLPEPSIITKLLDMSNKVFQERLDRRPSRRDTLL